MLSACGFCRCRQVPKACLVRAAHAWLLSLFVLYGACCMHSLLPVEPLMPHPFLNLIAGKHVGCMTCLVYCTGIVWSSVTRAE